MVIFYCPSQWSVLHGFYPKILLCLRLSQQQVYKVSADELLLNQVASQSAHSYLQTQSP